jgi:predicted enzyme related to lactoylglutathione lyase
LGIASSPKNGSSQRQGILSIDHLQLAMPVGEEEKARNFFIKIFGFHEIPKPAELAKRGGAWFESGNVQLHIGVEADFRPARKAHPAFLVDDLDALIAKAQSTGCEIDTNQPPLDGYKRAHVFDPFGNRIELMQKL